MRNRLDCAFCGNATRSFMNHYYTEEITKDTRYRQEYKEGIEAFLNERKKQADDARTSFISPEKYVAQPEYSRDELLKTLGYPLTDAVEAPRCCEKTFVSRDGNVNIYRMQLEFFGKIKFYGIYFEQADNPEEKPFLFGLHGGLGTPETVSSIHLNSSNYNHLVRRITDRGASVFAPQLLLWNTERYGNEYNRAHSDGKLRQLGGSITALELYLLSGALSYFISNENISENKIGVAGLSYGGMYAAHLAAIDTRIKACFSCSWVDDGFINSWSDWSYFNARSRFTPAEILGLVAPRSLLVAMGDKDDLFNCDRTVAECEKASPYFNAFGKEDNFNYYVFTGTHETDTSDKWLNFLFERLA